MNRIIQKYEDANGVLHRIWFTDADPNGTISSGQGAVVDDVAVGPTGNYVATLDQFGSNIVWASAKEGFPNSLYGQYSHVEGWGTTAGGETDGAAHAEGINTTAFSDGSHAEGYNTTAGTGGFNGLYAHAEGDSTTAAGHASHTEGMLTTAGAECAHAGGISAAADAFTAMWARASGTAGTTTGVTQTLLLDLQAESTDATPVELIFADTGVAPAIFNAFHTGGAQTAFGMTILVTARQYGGVAGTPNDSASWLIHALVKGNQTGFLSTLVGTPAVVSSLSDAGAATWAVNLLNTGSAFAWPITIEGTGEVDKTIVWHASVTVSKVGEVVP